MTQPIYHIFPLKKKNFIQQLFRLEDEDNAIIEVNNLLAAHPVTDITREQIHAISRKYQVNLRKMYERNLDELYAAYLKYAIRNREITDAENTRLQHLQHILEIPDYRAFQIHEQLAGQIYREALRQAIANGRLAKTENQALEHLRKNLKLTDATTEKISREEKTQRVKAYMDIAISDNRLSPEEELAAISKSLGVSVDTDQATWESLQRMKELWHIENAPLEKTEVHIHLPKSEYCYYSTAAGWFELRSARGRKNSDLLSDHRVSRGNLYRVGQHHGSITQGVILKCIDRGQLFLTNKRVLFMGELGNKHIRYDKILAFTPFDDGIEIEKDAGKSPFLEIYGDTEKLGLVLSRLLQGI